MNPKDFKKLVKDSCCLIAAAPCLLAACEAVFAWSQSSLPMDAMDDEVLEQVIDALRAAGSACVDDASLDGDAKA